MTLQLKLTKPVLALAIAVDAAVTTFAATVARSAAPPGLGDTAAALIVAVGGAVGVYLTVEEQAAPAIAPAA